MSQAERWLVTLESELALCLSLLSFPEEISALLPHTAGH